MLEAFVLWIEKIAFAGFIQILGGILSAIAAFVAGWFLIPRLNWEARNLSKEELGFHKVAEKLKPVKNVKGTPKGLIPLGACRI